MTHRIVPAPSRLWLAHGVLACVVAVTATGWLPGWAIVVSLVAILRAHLLTMAAVILAIVLPRLLWPPTTLPHGAIEGRVVTLSTAPTSGQFGWWALGTLDDVPVFLELPDDEAEIADSVLVTGIVTDDVATFAGRPRQVVRVEELVIASHGRSIYGSAGASIRRHVAQRVSGGQEGRALLAGFLVGDTSGVSDLTIEAMKKAGLSHFVAVSGSNVALFLGLVAIVSLPLGIGPRRRAVAGLAALPVFVVATGFEPSVLRASAMAALVLAGRAMDMTIEFWQVVALATIGLLALDPWLVRSVGFQLSLVATCGVLVGSRLSLAAGWLRRALMATVGAQVAVAPLLLWHFGSIPLFSPLANLIAAPLVTLATALAISGVVGPDLLLVPAEWIATVIIEIANTAASWPQVGWLGVITAALAAGAGIRLRHRSPRGVALVAAVFVAFVVLPRTEVLEAGEVAFLDVGQGDAILLAGGDGLYALVDGGRDPVLLLERLEHHGVRHVALVVVTHGDADHAGGLAGITGRIGIGEIWEHGDPHEMAASRRFLADASNLGIPIVVPHPGHTVRLGELVIEVLGPTRRYASPNDQSIVLLVTGPVRSMLLTGDIEQVAQSELSDISVNVLKVPHHGAGTSDRDWLLSTGAEEAVISVGANEFGHPVPWVVAALESAGSTVRRTDLDGTVIIDLGT